LQRREGLETFPKGVIRPENRLQQRQALRLPQEERLKLNPVFVAGTSHDVVAQELAALRRRVLEPVSDDLLYHCAAPCAERYNNQREWHCHSR